MNVITAAQVYGLGLGEVDVAMQRALRHGQFGKRRLLVAAVSRLRRREDPFARYVDAASELLRAAEQSAPDAVRQVLAHPQVDAWAECCVARLNVGCRFRSIDAAYLCGLAAAASIRGGLSFTLRAVAINERLWLPTFGMARLLGSEVVTVRGELDGTATIAGPGKLVRVGAVKASERWAPVRRLTTDDGFTVEIEDQDPFRAQYPWPVAGRLSTDEVGRLTNQLGDAWAWLSTRCPAHAVVIREHVRSFVPVRPPAERSAVSAAASRAGGAVALSMPDSAIDGLAQLLMHEARHLVLDAFADVLPIYQTGLSRLYHAPWRSDPRPIAAITQGVYAHLAVADFWRVRSAEVTGRRRAEFEFAYTRSMATNALAEVAGSAELTEPGRLFVDGMGSAAEQLLDQHVDAETSRGVADTSLAVALRWRLRNHVTSLDDVAMLRRRWIAGESPGMLTAPTVAAGPAAPAHWAGAMKMIGGAVMEPSHDGSSPDRAFWSGDFAPAAMEYVARLAARPDDDDSWVGVAMSVAGLRSDTAPNLLLERPELLRDLYGALVDDGLAVAPDAVARWFAASSHA